MFELNLIADRGLAPFDRQLPMFNWYYPFDCDLPPRPNILEAYSASTLSKAPRVAIYVHVPFCHTLCKFCPFTKGVFKAESEVEEYLGALISEIEAKRRLIGRRSVDVIAIGGGTPTILTDAQLLKLGEVMHDNFDLRGMNEFTCEVEAKSVTPSKLAALKEIGVNRVSIGAQTFASRHREAFGLDATIGQVQHAAALITATFPYTNADIIYGMPDQTQDELSRDIDEAVSLGTTTIDFYPLNHLAAQVRFHREAGRSGRPLLDASTRLTYRLAIDGSMRSRNYERISGYSYRRPSFEGGSVHREHGRFAYHDILYGYEDDVVLGYGADAVSYVPGFNVYNSPNRKTYVAQILGEGRLPQTAFASGSSPERGLVTFPYRGSADKNRIDWGALSADTLAAFEQASDAGLIIDLGDSYGLSHAGWLSYVNLMYFLMPLTAKRALSRFMDREIGRGKGVEDTLLKADIRDSDPLRDRMDWRRPAFSAANA